MIPLTRPYFDNEEMRAIQLPLESGWVVQGPFVEEFERKFSAFTGSRFSVTTTSCTTALHLAMVALGLKPGDEVIVTAFTWITTANAVEYMGARPVFCDINLDTFNIDVSQIESLITSRTVGIIPVHIFGLCADMNPILEIAKKHDLWVVEDAACGFGAYYYGQHAGTFGKIGCFSFHPRKAITTGEGGMIVTKDVNLDKLCRILRDHGQSGTEFNHLGYNYRMTDIQGALGCVQMDKGELILLKRFHKAKVYDEMLKDLDWLRIPIIPDGYIHSYQSYVCLLDSGIRDKLRKRLEGKGISSQVGTFGPVFQSYYSNKYGIVSSDFPNAYIADQSCLTLPLYPQMTEEEQSMVVRELKV